MRKTKQERNAEGIVDQLRRTASIQNDRIGELEHELRRAEETNKLLIQQSVDHAAVLQGDRDALTRALEVCTRRLASPHADRDPMRAGWRSQQAPDSPLNQKATDPRERLRQLGGFGTPSLHTADRARG